VETLTLRQVRRLALARGGLLKPAWTGLPSRGAGRGKRARKAAQAILRRFGYLQLDTVSIAGVRSHGLVLLSRLEGFDPSLAEELLQPGEPVFEYWGHEASWIPLELYPAFEFRRQEFHHHPWWGDVLGQFPQVTRRLRDQIRQEGPLRSIDMEGSGSKGWWDLKAAKRVASALWSRGELAIRERKNFQRAYDLAERVIPEALRAQPLTQAEGLEVLLLQALEGHGWATTGTLAATWRLRNCRPELEAALSRLEEQKRIVACSLQEEGGRSTAGWLRPEDLELAHRLDGVRPRKDRGVLLSPFDPLLWDRPRVQRLFGFEQILEIFKPAPQRKYGYYCLPVLAGEELVARFDLKAEKARGRLRLVARHFEGADSSRPPSAAAAQACRWALDRYCQALELALDGDPGC
jgi:uncharacterized protein YcaQ